ncbi:hypothetical protein HanPI659440_Chr14g0529321 [Helianthus annuus]|nr:hypothetical protein HanPI659440_Chr14g0529321 [Helianthus annuus]
MVERFFSTTNSPTTHDDPIILLSGPPPSYSLYYSSFSQTHHLITLMLLQREDIAAVPVRIQLPRQRRPHVCCFYLQSAHESPLSLQGLFGVDPSSNVFDRIQIK